MSEQGFDDHMNRYVVTRIHTGVPALLAAAHVLAIEYIFKTRGLINECGLSNMVVEKNDVESDLQIQKVDGLLQSEHEVVETITRVLPSVEGRPSAGVRSLREQLESIR